MMLAAHMSTTAAFGIVFGCICAFLITFAAAVHGARTLWHDLLPPIKQFLTRDVSTDLKALTALVGDLTGNVSVLVQAQAHTDANLSELRGQLGLDRRIDPLQPRG